MARMDLVQPESCLLSLVIPVYNERHNLEPLLEELGEVLPQLPCAAEVILVDDGSRDGSWEAIVELAARRPWLRALRFLGNQGQTAAMAAGIESAKGELVAFMDGDLQNDPHDLPALLAPILDGSADVACGWRSRRQDPAFKKRLPSVMANLLIRVVLDLEIHDVGCTLKVFRKVFLEDVQLFGEMHRFLPAYAKSQGARITEIKVGHRARQHGTSNYDLSRVYKVLIDLVTVTLLNAYGTKPAYFFGKIGLVFFGFGSAAFGVVAYRALVLGRPESTPMVFIMLLMYITSLLCFMSGLLAEINIRILHSMGSRRSFRVIDEVDGRQEPPAGPR